jgi:hypothetical protein
MDKTFSELQIKYFDLIHGDLKIEEFENWIYFNNFLENILNRDDYLDLISLNFKSKHIKYEIEKVLVKYIDYSHFERKRVLSLLYRALESRKGLPDILREFYDMYCHGYDFFQDLGLGYGLTCEVPPSKYGSDNWDELDEQVKNEIVNSFFPQIESDIQRAILWIENDKLILSGTKNETNHWEYADHRNDEEKKSTVWVEIPSKRSRGVSTFKNMFSRKNKKKWWKYWGK